MKMKPKSTVRNPKALVYKRFIAVEQSNTVSTVYYTLVDDKYWIFDCDTLQFTFVPKNLIPSNRIMKAILSTLIIVSYNDKYFRYINVGTMAKPVYAWRETDLTYLPSNLTFINASYNNIGKYQLNKYYYYGSFDYVIKGSIEGATSQYIKGNIIPLTSMNIKYFNDNIDLNVDDLVVIGKKIYSVENPETTMKMQPRPFKIHFATLNAIL